MRAAANLQSELDTLRTELRKPSASARNLGKAEQTATASGTQTAQTAAFAAGLEEQMKELGKVLSEHTGSTEDFIKEHQLASTLAAFVMGFAVGRLMGRT
jgi:hypothetical protein